MMYAKVENDVVVRVGLRPDWRNDDGSPVSDERLAQDGWLPIEREEPQYDQLRQTAAEDPMAAWEVYGDHVAVTWTVSEMALAERKSALRNAVMAKRWAVETAGFVWLRPGTGEVYHIATDATSQGKIDAERKAADAGRRRPGDVWKCGDPITGAIVYPALSDADIVEMSNAARDRVCDCFNREAALVAAVQAAEDDAALDAIDIEAGWPG